MQAWTVWCSWHPCGPRGSRIAQAPGQWYQPTLSLGREGARRSQSSHCILCVLLFRIAPRNSSSFVARPPALDTVRALHTPHKTDIPASTLFHLIRVHLNTSVLRTRRASSIRYSSCGASSRRLPKHFPRVEECKLCWRKIHSITLGPAAVYLPCGYPPRIEYGFLVQD